MATATATRIKWAIDPAHSELAFKVKHLMITNVTGQFREYEATVYTNGLDFTTAEVDVRVHASSVDTHDPKRDGHLKSADFFDAENHPEITFVSNTVERRPDDTYRLFGDLTIRGVTKRIPLEVQYSGMMKDPWGNEKHGFTVTGKINRKEWGLHWNAMLEGGGFLVAEEVRINCEVQLVRQPE